MNSVGYFLEMQPIYPRTHHLRVQSSLLCTKGMYIRSPLERHEKLPKGGWPVPYHDVPNWYFRSNVQPSSSVCSNSLRSKQKHHKIYPGRDRNHRTMLSARPRRHSITARTHMTHLQLHDSGLYSTAGQVSVRTLRYSDFDRVTGSDRRGRGCGPLAQAPICNSHRRGAQ